MPDQGVNRRILWETQRQEVAPNAALSASLGDALAEGWEPFAVTWDGRVFDYHLRRWYFEDAVQHPEVEFLRSEVANLESYSEALFRGHNGMWVHYFSTYCMHGLHDDCRLTCKHCKAPCRCECHKDRATDE